MKVKIDVIGKCNIQSRYKGIYVCDECGLHCNPSNLVRVIKTCHDGSQKNLNMCNDCVNDYKDSY